MLKDNKLNKSTPVPLYFQLKELILMEIKNGAYKYESLIPTEIELSEMFQISRTTVRQAVLELFQEGYLYRTRSKGTFVLRPQFSQNYVQTLESFNNQIYRTGRTPHTERLDLKAIIAPETVASILKIKSKDKVIYIQRRRFSDDEPILIVETYLPFQMCSFVMMHDLANESLYSVLATDAETNIKKIHRLTTAEEASHYEAENLKVKKGSAIQHVITIGYNMYGDSIEYSLARVRGHTNSYEIFSATNII